MKTFAYSRLLSLAVAGILAGATTLRADSRDDRVEDAFKSSHVYKTQLQQSDISINCKDGVVTLKGNAQNDDQRRLAEDTARSLPGVDRVDDQIRVTNEPRESSDEWIALKVRSALLFHRNVSESHTKVRVESGVVTLTGTASSEAEKALSEEYAKDIKGVRRVDNELRVVSDQDRAEAKAERREADAKADSRLNGDRPAGRVIDDASITAQLKSALAVHKSTSAVRTDVITRDGVVTITGQARNGAEKDYVTKIAENIDGVRSVRNDMTVLDH